MDVKNYEQAEQDYMAGMKYKEIAAKYGVAVDTVKSWKTRYKWNRKGVHTKKKKVCTQKAEEKKRKQEAAEQVSQVLENPELNDQQRLFCLYYTKSFNATQAYRKAYPDCSYESATVRSCMLMKEERIREEIFRLKQAKMNKAMLEPEDIFQKYMEIAFSDMSDFVQFGREEIAILSKGEPVLALDEETGEPQPLTQEVNTVRFRESAEVDGSLISEISQGKDGAKIKLLDKMKALDWLAAHMDLATEEQRAKVALLHAQRERLQSSMTSEADTDLTITIDYGGKDDED